MSSVRYFLALALLVSLPPAFFFWLLIHPFVRFWRRLGPAWAYGAVGGVVVLGMLCVFQIRQPLLATEFGTRAPPIALGFLCLAGAARMFVALRKQLSVRTQSGLPELDPVGHPSKLLTEGIYARIRHPRYVEFLVGLLGWALIANYLAIYVLVLFWLPGIYVITLLEERELRDRFGAEYEAYCRRVPRFLPRLGRLSRSE